MDSFVELKKAGYLSIKIEGYKFDLYSFLMFHYHLNKIIDKEYFQLFKDHFKDFPEPETNLDELARREGAFASYMRYRKYEPFQISINEIHSGSLSEVFSLFLASTLTNSNINSVLCSIFTNVVCDIAKFAYKSIKTSRIPQKHLSHKSPQKIEYNVNGMVRTIAKKGGTIILRHRDQNGNEDYLEIDCTKKRS